MTWGGNKMTLSKHVYKQTRTFYTDEKLNNVRKNLTLYEWAQEVSKKAVEAAESYLQFGNENLYNLVTSQLLPRSYGVNQLRGCPVCKKEIDRYGNYPWLGDPIQN